MKSKYDFYTWLSICSALLFLIIYLSFPVQSFPIIHADDDVNTSRMVIELLKLNTKYTSHVSKIYLYHYTCTYATAWAWYYPHTITFCADDYNNYQEEFSALLRHEIGHLYSFDLGVTAGTTYYQREQLATRYGQEMGLNVTR
jgi:hypothetical protein